MTGCRGVGISIGVDMDYAFMPELLSNFLWILSAKLLGSLAVGDAEKAGVIETAAVAVGAGMVAVGAAGVSEGAPGLASGVMVGV